VPERWLHERPKSQTLIKQLLDEPGSEMGRLMHQVTPAVMHGQFHGLLLMLATAEAKPSQGRQPRSGGHVAGTDCPVDCSGALGSAENATFS